MFALLNYLKECWWPSTAAVRVYEQKRSELIKADRALRVDNATTTALEDQADKLVRSIRAEEAVTVWGVAHEGTPYPYPGMEFLLGVRYCFLSNTCD